MNRRSVSPLSRNVLVVALMVVVGALSACDGGNGSDASSSSSTTTTKKTKTPEFSGENSAEFCTRYREFNTTYTAASLDPATVPVDQLAARWAASISALQGMESVASPEIQADVTKVRELVEAVQPALAAVGYDQAKLPAAEREQYQGAAANAATKRFSAYGAQVCEPESGK